MSVIISDPVESDEIFNGRIRIPISKGEIHIWNVSLDFAESLIQKCLKLLSSKEQERVTFFKFKKVQNNYVISQGVLRLLLSNYLNILPEKIQIGQHAKGKPYSIDQPKLRFNMSNSGRKTVYAFSLDDEIGIDIEFIRDLPDFQQLIERNFTPEERNYINKSPRKKQNRFFKFWTIKESYLKAIGEGMRLTPDNLEFTIENGNFKLKSIRGVFEQDDWIFEDFTLGANYIGTVTFKNVQSNIVIQTMV